MKKDKILKDEGVIVEPGEARIHKMEQGKSIEFHEARSTYIVKVVGFEGDRAVLSVRIEKKPWKLDWGDKITIVLLICLLANMIVGRVF